MDEITRAKWDKTARLFDILSHGTEKRWAAAKQKLFARMGDGPILFLAVGTGLDLRFFPAGKQITAIDISPAMVEQARLKAIHYPGSIDLQVMDVHDMPFPDHHFHQIFTSCTFCSVPEPVRGLIALRRVLKPGGTLHMFEHTGSHHFPFKGMLNIMTPPHAPHWPGDEPPDGGQCPDRRISLDQRLQPLPGCGQNHRGSQSLTATTPYTLT